MSSRHPVKRPAHAAANSPTGQPSESADPEQAEYDRAIQLEREATDCNDPAAVAAWCRTAHAFLAAYLQGHESYRQHQGDRVCQVIARATYDRARRSPFCPADITTLLGPQPPRPPWIAGNVALAHLQRLAHCCETQLRVPAPVSACPPLSDTEQKVLALIKAQPPGSGILGRQIIAQLHAEGYPLLQSTLTRHVIRNLKLHAGVKNRPGVGYYCAQA